jgi:hypothetical protein
MCFSASCSLAFLSFWSLVGSTLESSTKDRAGHFS